MKLTLNELTYVYEAAKEAQDRCIRWGTEEDENGEKKFDLSNLSDSDQRTYKTVTAIIEKLEKVEF